MLCEVEYSCLPHTSFLPPFLYHCRFYSLPFLHHCCFYIIVAVSVSLSLFRRFYIIIAISTSLLPFRHHHRRFRRFCRNY